MENHDEKRECGFDLDRLNLHRSMSFDIISKDKTANIEGLAKLSIYLQEHDNIRELLQKYAKYIRLLLTSTQTGVVAKRFFLH